MRTGMGAAAQEGTRMRIFAATGLADATRSVTPGWNGNCLKA